MRTCPKCGCYIPDNWTICPACDARVKISEEALPTRPCYNNTTSKVFPGGVYRVKLYYKDNTTSDTLFGIYENALKYAVMSEKRYSVQFVEVWDCQTNARLLLLS